MSTQEHEYEETGDRFTLADYWRRVALVYSINGSPTRFAHPWRLGQTAFNVLAEVRPDLSEWVRGGPADPFYATDEADPRYEAFSQFLAESWDEGRQR